MISLLSLLSLSCFASQVNLRGTSQISFDTVPVETYYCISNYQCPTNSNCGRFNSTIGICECLDEYASKDGFCDYGRKSWVAGLVLSTLNFFGPINIFYTLDGIHSTDEFMQKIAYAHLFTCGIIGYLIVVPLPTLFISMFNGDTGLGFAAVMSVIYIFLSFCWFIVDVIYFADDVYVDAYGFGMSVKQG